jgi:DNA-binding beta-propeller fold protein YncE
MAIQPGAWTSALAALLLAGACMADESTGSKDDLGATEDDSSGNHGSGSGSGNLATATFEVTYLLSDQPGVATHTDAALKDAWGVASLQERFSIAAQITGQLVLADSTGAPQTHLMLDDGITGIALNQSDQIQISIGSQCGAAQMLVASETGRLWGVSSALSTTQGAPLVNRSSVGAEYTGVAIIQPTRGKGGGGHDGSDDSKGGNGGNNAARPRVLAVDFHNERVDVFDEHFHLTQGQGQKFRVPDLPKGFSPFGILATEDRVFLTFAKRRSPLPGEQFDQQVAGAGLGIVAAFDLNGKLLWRTQSQLLNVPWGTELGNFGLRARAELLVGNHGAGGAARPCQPPGTCVDANKNGGTVSIIDPATGKVLGQLIDVKKQPIVVPGLWGLTFSTGTQDLHPNGLYTAAGPEDVHGLFAVIEPTPGQVPP